MKRILAIVFMTLLSSVSVAETAKQFIAIVDAGSTGSRAYVYQYVINSNGLPRLREIFQEKQTPGLATMARTPHKAGPMLENLLQHAAKAIQQAGGEPGETTLHVFATAGMRLIPESQQQAIYQALNQYLIQQPLFKVGQLKTLTGQQEGIFDWITVNHILNQLYRYNAPRTFGVLDMGGASTQIAFVSEHSADAIRLTLGQQQYSVFAYSFLGLGQDQARQHINEFGAAEVCYPTGSQKGNQYAASECRYLTESLVATYDIQQIIPNISKHTKFVAFNGYFHTYNFFNSKNDGSLRTVKGNIKQICQLSWDELRQRYPNENPKYLKNYCFNGQYLLTLFDKQVGYPKLNQRNKVYFSNYMHGKSINWAYGAAVYMLSGEGLW